ncbi:uncharacterized protein H6S33_003717 [Morchella sextelata]|uniref:uncharacterized protein n=1 Tax=Morchella sextelata TaxID=1174677 RepID=UPI001D0543D3|nr:uncharacterized protein H6S33_003717 [Morchella sextelata]KAH0606883.1 hypothetical protein H6S33_003717 [Morchella sextelata]
MWDLTRLLFGSLLCVTCPSQPRFLGGVLIATAALGMSLEKFKLSSIPWCVVAFTYISLHIFAVVLSPLQILWIKSKPLAQSSSGIVIHHQPKEDEGKASVDIVAVHEFRAVGGFDGFANGLDKFANGLEVFANGLEVFANGLEVFANGLEALVTAGSKNLDSRFNSIEKSMLGAIFLGVPHDGSRLTSVGKLMSYTTYWLGSSTQLLESLQPRDESLRELNASFLQGYGRRDLINFFERHMTRMGQFPLLLAVDRNSSTFASTANLPLESNHVGMNKYATLQDENYKLVLSEIKRIVEKIKSEPLYITPEYKDCLKTLDYPGSGNRRAAIEKSHKSTLGWLDTDPSISGWFESEVNCHMNKKPGEATLSFFFSDRGGDLDKSEAGCLRSLQHQLLKQIPALSDYILPEYKLRKEQHAEVLWHTEAIKKMLISMIGSSYVSSIRIVIDAIDECQNTSKFTLLDFIHDKL